MSNSEDEAEVLHDKGVEYVKLYYEGDKKDQKQNLSLAIQYFKQSAEKGCARALARLGIICQFDLDEYPQAIAYYKEAIEKGEDRAADLLADMYIKGVGGESNIRAAILALEDAAQKGYTKSQFKMAKIYQEGIRGLPDDQKAFEWFFKAASADRPVDFSTTESGTKLVNNYVRDPRLHRNTCNKARYEVGTAYRFGRGVSKNSGKAFEFLLEAANDVVGRTLGPDLSIGTVFEELYRQKIDFYKSFSGEDKIPEAVFAVAIMYYHGEGVAQSFEKAKQYFDEFEALLPDNKNIPAQMAVDLLFYRGKMYLEGQGVSKDTEQARNCLGFAAKHGHVKARKLLEEIDNPEQKKSGISDIPKTALEKLDDLIGLASVKNQIGQMINLIKLNRARQERGMKTGEGTSLHLVFTGNPGTGKTTVARLVGEIYKSLGLLKKGHVIEVERRDLIAEYMGQTAPKTQEKIQQAMNGILFIDEAYSLAPEGMGGHDYGGEAIATILTAMENNRDCLAVIVAGYKDEMNRFIDSNTGLQSRFNRYINFQDYNPLELVQIFKFFADKAEYSLAPDAEEALTLHFQKIVSDPAQMKNFGNGRFARNLFEAAKERQASRIISSERQNFLDLITKADLGLE